VAATSTITVQQIHCPACENTIRTVLGKAKGIRSVHPDAATNTVKVTYDEGKLSEADIRTTLADIGFDPVA